MASPVVATAVGQVRGITADGVQQFRGIPYARAGRFRAPTPIEPWFDVRPCDGFGPIAPQGDFVLDAILGRGRADESEPDCLSLNVFTPAAADRARPVMVWIHGGGFVSGSGRVPWYSGSRLAAAGDVVVVTINYRLGVLGFLHLTDADFVGSGNNGLRDQIAALEWVRDNIATFGGDPGNVTLFGESAGAVSAGALLGAPAARGLFHRAILQSGSPAATLPAPAAAAVTAAYLDEMGTTDLELLLEAPTQELLAAQNRLLTRRTTGPEHFLDLAPVIDSVVLLSPHLGADTVPLLIGTTADEYHAFTIPERATNSLDEARLQTRTAKLLGADAIDAIDAYRSERPDASAADVWSALMTEWAFRIPAIRLAENVAAAGGDAWMYRFSYRSLAFDGLLGACHGIDIPFVFDNVHRNGVDQLLGPVTDATRRLARTTSRAWLHMAHNGAPGHDELPDWPTYAAGRRAVMDLDVRCELVTDPGSRLARASSVGVEGLEPPTSAL